MPLNCKYFAKDNLNKSLRSRMPFEGHNISQMWVKQLSCRVSDPSNFNRRIRIFWIRFHLKMHRNLKCQSGKFITTFLIIGFCNYRYNYIRTGQQNNQTNFHNLADPKACYFCVCLCFFICMKICTYHQYKKSVFLALFTRYFYLFQILGYFSLFSQIIM